MHLQNHHGCGLARNHVCLSQHLSDSCGLRLASCPAQPHAGRELPHQSSLRSPPTIIAKSLSHQRHLEDPPSTSNSFGSPAPSAHGPRSPAASLPPAGAPPPPSRRAVLLGVASAFLLPPAAAVTGPAAAARRPLHSRRSDVACCLTVRNRSPRTVEARWVNYDGDEEPYTTILPGHVWTVDTFETHPWRFRDASTGDLVCEYVAQAGDRLLQLYDDPAGILDLNLGLDSGGGNNTTAAAGGSAPALADSDGAGEWRRRQRRLRQRRQLGRYGQSQHEADAADQFAATTTTTTSGNSPQKPLTQRLSQPSQKQPTEPFLPSEQLPPAAAVSERPGMAGGFDGLGNPAGQYTAASLLSVAVLPREGQAVVVLGLEGYERPLSLLVGVPEARSIVNAAGSARGRRPTTLATWVQTLQALGGALERVVITRQVDGVFYARIVLSQTWRGRVGPGPGPQAGGCAAGGGGGAGTAAPLAAAAAVPGDYLISVDARPSDALALALEAGADVFVSIPLAELVQQQYPDAERDLADQLVPQPPSAPAPPLQGRGQPGGDGGMTAGEGEGDDGLGFDLLDSGGGGGARRQFLVEGLLERAPSV